MPALCDVPEAGWAFHPDVHGRGYASEAMRALLGWADGRNMRRTCCISDGENSASTGLAARLGYVHTRTVTYHGKDLILFTRN